MKTSVQCFGTLINELLSKFPYCPEYVPAHLLIICFSPCSDLIGRVQIPVKELIKTPNKMVRRTDPLMGFEDADAMDGKLQ